MVFVDRILTYGRMIKFSHSVFALPFALSGAALAAVAHPILPEQVVWIVVAMVGARSAAMGFNRLVDREIDATNPRTANRELPRGVISPAATAWLIGVSSLALIFAAYKLNPLCFMLSPVALGIVFFYSYTKRFTWATQAFLGLALGVAPIGAWIAITGELNPEILILGGAVLTWVAGFDIIYSCQDVGFDQESGLYSLPQRFGVRGALWISRGLYVVSFGLFSWAGTAFGMGAIYFAGVFVIGGFLVYEHLIVKANDLSRVNVAFMTMNGLVSLVYLVFTLGDMLL
ncbi:MAG: putative 4-hydroxybenzoate polyprenyltransferase [bacterium]|nr:putative 4-hydroxybenzoate polyprenyltransferase [bacterium]